MDKTLKNITAGGEGGRLIYNIYKDPEFTKILGDGTKGTYVFKKTFWIHQGGTHIDNYSIYAKIPVQALTPAGTYHDDSIKVKLDFW